MAVAAVLHPKPPRHLGVDVGATLDERRPAVVEDDGPTLRRAFAETKLIVTVEDHWVEGGLGDAVLEALSAAGGELDGRVIKLGVTEMPGSGTPEELRDWAGISAPRGVAAFDALRRRLTPVRTPVGDAWILTSDEPTFRVASRPAASARLLPSGDAYFLLQGRDRELLIPDASRRRALWTPRVWPGAVLVGGEIVGTWRRAVGTVTIQAWRRLTRAARDAIEAEVASLPLPDLRGRVVVRWED